MRLLTAAGACLASIGLTACGVPTGVTLASYAADGASLLSTGRSILLQEDCALFRVVQGKPVCQPMQPDDLVYDIAFADRTYDYGDPTDSRTGPPPVLLADASGAVGAETSSPLLPARANALPDRPARERIPWAVANAPRRSEPAEPREVSAPPVGSAEQAVVVLPRQRPRTTIMAAVVPPPRPNPLAAPLPPPAPGYQIVAGAFNRLEGAKVRRDHVVRQLARLGYRDIAVEIARLPEGSVATYVVLTRPLVPQRASSLLGQLKLDRGENPWKVRSGRYDL